jgi:Fic family protein
VLSDVAPPEASAQRVFAQLPPNPALQLEGDILHLLSQANINLGKLDGLTSVIKDADLFVYLFVRKEALLSSQIEGTQCSLEDVLADEKPTGNKKDDIEEVSNYVAAMNKGLRRLAGIFRGPGFETLCRC